jgi:hypothetical protein
LDINTIRHELIIKMYNQLLLQYFELFEHVLFIHTTIMSVPSTTLYQPSLAVGVFLGANSGKEEKFTLLSLELASLFAEQNWKLGDYSYHNKYIYNIFTFS